MTSVTVDRLTISLASDLEQAVTVWSSDRSDEQAQSGEVRRYANGRLRLVTRAGTARELRFTLRVVDASTLAMLRSWLGRVVLVRDHRGRKMYGSYLALPVVDWPADAPYVDIPLTVAEVTVSEAV